MVRVGQAAQCSSPTDEISEDPCLAEEKAPNMTPFLPLSTDIPIYPRLVMHQRAPGQIAPESAELGIAATAC
jgi:hypothetical protein